MSESKSGRHITFFNARLTSTISISLVLFILGIVVLMGILATRLSMYVKENMGFSIVLKENVKESQVKKLQKKQKNHYNFIFFKLWYNLIYKFKFPIIISRLFILFIF